MDRIVFVFSPIATLALMCVDRGSMDSGNDAIRRLEERLREIDRERLTLLGKLRAAKAGARSPQRPLELDRRAYPETPAAKVALFETMFVARRDVYPRLWENKDTGRKGYSPVCEAVWENGRRLKPTEIFARYGAAKFQVLDSGVIEAHLRGRIVAGTYAIRQDDRCVFLAADFDGSGWQADAAAYRDEAAALGIECLVEISRSGNGAHVWILFAEPVPASLARNLGSLILARAAGRHPAIRLDTYDRFFPNQDTLPKGGFGNLIALPLQRERRQHGFTEFVDDAFKPFSDQWAVLANARRLTGADIDAILLQHTGIERTETQTPLDLEELILNAAEAHTLDLPVIPDRSAALNEALIIPTETLSEAMVSRIRAIATFPNPIFFEKQRQRFPTYNIPRYLFSGEIHEKHIILPRGCIEEAMELFASCGSRLEMEDRRLRPKRLAISFSGTLQPRQKAALNEILPHDTGVLVAPPGAGKTVIACALIARRKVPSLILVNRQALLKQWSNRLQEFTSIEKKAIGALSGTRKKMKGMVDIAMIQTLANHDNPKALFRNYGMVIVDECHHIPAVSLEALMKECGSRYIVGLTATPQRKDRLEPLLYHQCGPIRTILGDQNDDGLEKILRLRITRFMAFTEDGKPLPLHLTWQQLIDDDHRNRQITGDIVAAVHAGAVPIALSDRREHLETLHKLVSAEFGSASPGLQIIEGTLSQRQRDKAIAEYCRAVANKEPACLFATSSLLGEGFDLPCLDTLFLTMPLSFKGRLIQYAGRLHRTAPGKTTVTIYDYLDELLPVANSMYRRRSPAYRTMGYREESDPEALDL